MSAAARTSESFTADDSSEKATNWAFTVGALTSAAIGFAVGANDGSPATAVFSASFGGILSGALIRTGLAPSACPQPRRPRRIRGPYGSVEQLVAAKTRFTLSRAVVGKGLKDKQDLRRRLMSLRTKMEDVALPQYRPRIASIDMALVTIDKQIAMGTRLRDGYDKSITMIEIELESGVAADQMHEDISAAIFEAMRELKALEASQAELALQLEANVEVEQLLRPRN